MADSLKADYLVVGAGAAGLAFLDSLIAASDRSAVLVDRRHAPGGHWIDAYPFVRLHQPSAYYGVSSLPLGDDRVDTRGPNAGMYEVASTAEICAYFQRVLDRLVDSGRVHFLPLSHHEQADDGSHRITSLLDGRTTTVEAGRKLVDATYLQNSVPATHTRNYEVDGAVRCVPIGELPRALTPRGRYVVIGAGKTAMDACLWLLDHGLDPARLRWIKPREAWVLDRKYSQSGELIAQAFEGVVRQFEAAAHADSLPDLFARLEATGQLMRIDQSVEPSMYRCATVTARELSQLRRITDVLRLGRVTRIEPERIVLQQGSVAASPDDLYVDCSAVALITGPSPGPIFDERAITIQPLRTCQPCFNSALIGHLEATRDDDAEKNALCAPNPYPAEPVDWARMFLTSNITENTWASDRPLSDWIGSTRLNVMRGFRERRKQDPELAAQMQRFKAAVVPGLQNVAGLITAPA